MPRGLRQLARRQCRIGKDAQAERRIDAFRDQIDDAIIHHQFQPKLRMRIEKCAELRNDVQPPECNRDRNSESASHLVNRCRWYRIRDFEWSESGAYDLF